MACRLFEEDGRGATVVATRCLFARFLPSREPQAAMISWPASLGELHADSLSPGFFGGEANVGLHEVPDKPLSSLEPILWNPEVNDVRRLNLNSGVYVETVNAREMVRTTFDLATKLGHEIEK